MDASYLFTAALQLLSPWKVGSVDFRDAGDGWLRNEESLTELQVETKRGLTRQRLKTARACRMREVLQDIYMDGRTPADAWVGLYRLCSWMMHSRLEPMKELARLVRRHFAEIVAYFEHPYTNAVLEGVKASSRTSNDGREASATWTTSPP